MSNTRSDRFANSSTDANGDFHICVECDRHFCTNRGHNQHLRLCYLKNKIIDVQTPYERNEDDATDQTPDDSNTEIPDNSTYDILLRYKWAIIKINFLREIYFPFREK